MTDTAGDAALAYDELPLPPTLTPLVRAVWHLRGAGPAPDAEPIVPDGCVEIIVNLGDPVEQYLDGRVARQPARMLVGQITGPTVIRPTGRIDIWGVRVHPWALRQFLGVPGRELVNVALPLDALPRPLGAAVAAFEDAAAAGRTGGALLAPLVRRAAAVGPVDRVARPLVEAATNRAHATSVAALARELGLGARRVQQLFREEVGLAPKFLLRLQRFQRALRLSRERPDLTWGRVAARCGYHDQAHLVRECRELAGCPPSALGVGGTGMTDVFVAG